MKIGITMRRDGAAHGEIRDSVATDWWRFLSQAFPDGVIVPLPNTGLSALRAAVDADIGGLILTGGADIGAFPERDSTEHMLLGWADRMKLPVICICRGLQMMNHVRGGSLVACSPSVHVAARHGVDLLPGGASLLGMRSSVNSFHQWAASPDSLAKSLLPLAHSAGPEIVVEAAMSADGREIGIMWHPEREATADEADLALFRRHLR